jgi:hypothetical protein
MVPLGDGSSGEHAEGPRSPTSLGLVSKAEPPPEGHLDSTFLRIQGRSKQKAKGPLPGFEDSATSEERGQFVTEPLQNPVFWLSPPGNRLDARPGKGPMDPNAPQGDEVTRL